MNDDLNWKVDLTGLLRRGKPLLAIRNVPAFSKV
jgi:hypothetical protein